MSAHKQVHRPGMLALRSALATCLFLLLSTPAAGDQSSSAVRDAQWQISSGHLDRAWLKTRGHGVIVAVIDSGVNAVHPDLEGQVLPGGDFSDGSSASGLQDSVGPRGHGTQVASLVAGSGRNFQRRGLYGAAPEATVLAAGVYRNGAPVPGAVARAIRASVVGGARVLVTPPLDPENAAQVAAVRWAHQQDAVVVAAQPTSASRASAEPVPGVLTVTAVDRHGVAPRSSMEAGGPALAGPGVQVLAASSDGTYWTGDDNSFAAAWVAGTAALVRAAHPDYTAAQTVQALVGTATDDGRCGAACSGVVAPDRAVLHTAVAAREGSAVSSAAGGRPEAGSMVDTVARLGWMVGGGFLLASVAVIAAAAVVRRSRARPGATPTPAGRNRNQ